MVDTNDGQASETVIKYAKINHPIEPLLPLLVEAFETNQSVDVLYVYGSRAGGRISSLSDIDLAVLVSGSVEKRELLDIRLQMIGEATSVLKTDEVDLQILNDIPVQAQYSILKNKRVLYCRDEFIRAEFEAGVVTRYLDFKPFLDDHYRAMYQRIEDRAIASAR